MYQNAIPYKSGPGKPLFPIYFLTYIKHKDPTKKLRDGCKLQGAMVYFSVFMFYLE